ncbi:MAG: CPBP family intramembrane metalloprotease [Candidatus Lokiarchaeota archaeon]|nr:CPBP family intramembrane metalloprotease [Candidatus Lokiarchaeota archaeon]MBD3200807.1 CPBP family intramembrane metalloprotease [Candidatus Lokiarchaeota archaeon]
MDRNSINIISKIVLTCVVIILIIIQYDLQYVLLINININNFFIVIISFLILLFIGLLIVYFGFSRECLEIMENHEVVNGLLRGQFNVLYLSFLITMIMEELIFRYLIIKILKYVFLEEFIVILISAVIFSLYHIHIWFEFKKFRITLSYISFSFLVGLFLNNVFYRLGLLFCIILHYVIALFVYFLLSRRIEKYRDNSKIIRQV